MIDWSLLSSPSSHLVGAALLAGLIGGFVRGYSGFGFALAAVPVLSLVLPPVAAVPAVLPLEFAIGLATVPLERSRIEWPALWLLVLGTLAGTPLGLMVLAYAPANAMRVAIGAVVICAVLLFWSRPKIGGGTARPSVLSAAGFASGLMNGGTAMGAPPVFFALLTSGFAPSATRATLMALIGFNAALGLVLAAAGGLYATGAPALAGLLMAPAAAAGAFAGNAVFARTAEAHYRPASLAILFAVGCIAVASAGWTLLTPPSP